MAIFQTDRPHRSRLIITGTAGGIGTLLRGKLDHVADEIVLSDLDHVDVSGNETSHPCDITDLDALRGLLKGGGDVLHFGGQSVEAPFVRICEANLVGTYNLYEAARLEGIRRVLFASSNHAIGFHTRETTLDADSATRPDSLYGVSKVYGEALASLYFDKFGIESLLLRIGSCFEKPADRRQLATWMSPGDMVRLIERMVSAPRLACTVVYGVSDNEETWWDNSKAAFLGWHPQDTSEPWREELEASTPVPTPHDPAVIYQGGAFVPAPHPGTKMKREGS
ncbi:MAG: NAD(P)-dependent oxidoreductase [Pseudomonadota bacterium]